MSVGVRDALLLETLRIAVPMRIARHRVDPPKPTRVHVAGQNVAEYGDILQFKSKGTAMAFNSLAESLAILARQPGGVDFMGQHWCTDHTICEAAS